MVAVEAQADLEVQGGSKKKETSVLLVSFFCHESYSHCQEKKNKYEAADAACDVAVSYKERHVIAKRNLTFDYSRLPPRGRLKYLPDPGKGKGYPLQYSVLQQRD